LVKITRPPPENPQPLIHHLSPGEGDMLRIFTPGGRYNTVASSFRFGGLSGRFDHHRNMSDSTRGIYYAGFTLECCILEVFKEKGLIEREGKLVANVKVIEKIALLDLFSGPGPIKAGMSSAATVTDSLRDTTQEWARYFYENTSIYGDLDGILYRSAYDNELQAVALFERAKEKILCPSEEILPLDDPRLIEKLMHIANLYSMKIDDLEEHEN
jgi:RES domain